MSFRKVSIIIPSIREEGLNRCIKAIEENSGVPSSQYEILVDRTKESPSGAINAVNRLTHIANNDLVFFLADDCVPMENFLLEALKEMEKFPDGWGLVGTNDYRNHEVDRKDELATFWMGHKKLLPLLGGDFFCPEYWHTFCDLELTQRCMELDRYIFSKNIKIFHDHPLAEKSRKYTKDLEGDYAKFYSNKWWVHDIVLFRKRKRKGWPECRKN